MSCQLTCCMTDEPNVFFDIQMFDNMDAFMQHVDSSKKATMDAVMNFVQHYEPKPLQGVVVGGWDQRVVMITSKMGAQFTFTKAKAGFIRKAPAGKGCTPTIIAARRRVQKDKMC